MKQVYTANVEVKFQEKRGGYSGFDMCEGVFDSIEDAVAHIKKIYWEVRERELTEETSNLEFMLETPMIYENSKEHLAEAGDKVIVWITRTDYYTNSP